MHTLQNQTKIKDKRTVFSFWKAAIKKGRQLVCSAVSLCGYPSPLASALLPFENTAEAKKKQLSLNWMKKKKKTHEGEIRSDTDELNLLWTGSQIPSTALGVLLLPMPLRVPSGDRSKGCDKAGQHEQPHPDSPNRDTTAWAPGPGHLLLHRNNNCCLSHRPTNLALFCVASTKVWEIKGIAQKAKSTFPQPKYFLTRTPLLLRCSQRKKESFLKYGCTHHSCNELRILFLGPTIGITEILLPSNALFKVQIHLLNS